MYDRVSRWTALTAITFLVPLSIYANPPVPPNQFEYQVTFDSIWSSQTHPVDFPPAPHYSPLIAAVHSDQVSFWQSGGLATPGIEVMAETGSPTTLSNEIDAAVTAGTALTRFVGSGLNSPGSLSFDLIVTVDNPLVTLVTMIAPSPDWFVGVSGVQLYDGGVWVDQVTIDLFGYDSGTDSGITYLSSNSDTVPQEPITMITTGPLSSGGALGTLTFTRIVPPCSFFVRGDCAQNSVVDLSDAVTILGTLFSGESVLCEGACDVDDSGSLNIGDAILLLNYLFQQGVAPAPPFPSCDQDPTQDTLSCASPLCPPP